MTTDSAKIVSLAMAIIECVKADSSYSSIKLEDNLTELIHTLLYSTDSEKQWAGLMAVERSVQIAVEVARQRGMEKLFIDGILRRIQMAML